jgi:hypothetical protein
MQHKFTITIVAFLTLAMACKKSSDTNDNLVKEYVFNNAISVPINVKVYESLVDYKNSANPVYASVVPPYSKVNWTLPTAGKQYYIDWFSSEYNMSNWGYKRLLDNSYECKLPLDLNYNQITFSYNEYNNPWCRNSIINGNNPQTQWSCVDILDINSGLSIKPSLPAYKLYHQLTLRKDMSYEHAYKTGEDATASTNKNYNMINTGVSIMKGSLDGGDGLPMYFHTVSHLPIQNGTYTRDTILLQLPEGYAVMAKQK